MIELASGATRTVIDPAHGFRCTRFTTGDWSVVGARGMRIEFPWVGAKPARSARLRIGATTLDIGGGPPEALADRGWIVDDDATALSRQARARLRTDATASAYPFDVELLATWCLDAEGLRLELEVTNRSKQRAPFGIGIRVDLGPIGAQVQALAPAEHHWQMGPNGATSVAVSGRFDLRRPAEITAPIVGQFTRRHFANLQTQLAVLCPETGKEIWLSTSSDFREAELAINPDGSGTLASATCTPDAFALHAEGVATGLRALGMGETWRGHALLVAVAGTA